MHLTGCICLTKQTELKPTNYLCLSEILDSVTLPRKGRDGLLPLSAHEAGIRRAFRLGDSKQVHGPFERAPQAVLPYHLVKLRVLVNHQLNHRPVTVSDHIIGFTVARLDHTLEVRGIGAFRQSTVCGVFFAAEPTRNV